MSTLPLPDPLAVQFPPKSVNPRASETTSDTHRTQIRDFFSSYCEKRRKSSPTNQPLKP
jgi:hypothetical protein